MIDNREVLGQLADEALSRWPDLAYVSKYGHRGAEAAALVRKGKIRQHGATFEVAGHTCTIRPNHCTCNDAEAPVDPQYGRLCPHRLAAMFVCSQRYRDSLQRDDLLDALRRADTTGRIFLVLEDPDDQDTRRLVGIQNHTMGRPQRWRPDESVIFTYEQFKAALAALGWSLADVPRKGPGYVYYWRLQPDTNGLDLTRSRWHLHGTTEAMQERAKSERMAKWAAQEYAANLG